MNKTAFVAMRAKLDQALREAVKTGIAWVYNKRGFCVGCIRYIRGNISPFQFESIEGRDLSSAFLASLKV